MGYRTGQGRRTALLLAGLVLAIVSAGCDRARDDAASNATRPAVDVPIGPPPGPDPDMDVASNPYQGDAGAMQEGRRLFVWFNCAGCHGSHAGGGMGPSLRDPTWIYGNGEAEIFSSIANGRAYGMPAWGTKLPEEQIWRIVTYIGVLGTPKEPAPPPENPSWPQPVSSGESP